MKLHKVNEVAKEGIMLCSAGCLPDKVAGEGFKDTEDSGECGGLLLAVAHTSVANRSLCSMANNRTCDQASSGFGGTGGSSVQRGVLGHQRPSVQRTCCCACTLTVMKSLKSGVLGFWVAF